jgi:hypothetical protein
VGQWREPTNQGILKGVYSRTLGKWSSKGLEAPLRIDLEASVSNVSESRVPAQLQLAGARYDLGARESLKGTNHVSSDPRRRIA